MTQLDATKPIEVWLRQRNLEMDCWAVFEDETSQPLDVASLSMRGAQREITAYLIGQGYDPVARWESEDAGECVRLFRPARTTAASS